MLSIVSRILHSLSTADFTSRIFTACGIGKNLCANCSVKEVNPLLEIRSSWFLVCTDSALSRRFMGLHRKTKIALNSFIADLRLCARSHDAWISCTRHRGSHKESLSNFLLAFLRISGFSLSCGTNYSQSSSIVELRFLLCPFLFLLLLSGFINCRPNSKRYMIWSGNRLNPRQSSSRHQISYCNYFIQ